MPSQPIASHDAVRSLSLPVAQAMRELADRLSALCSESDQERISALSAELQGVGWSALFASASIERFLQLSRYERNSTGDEARKEVSRRLDSLLVAANYLEQSVKHLKSQDMGLCDGASQGEDGFVSLAAKLGEIIHACQRSTK